MDPARGWLSPGAGPARDEPLARERWRYQSSTRGRSLDPSGDCEKENPTYALPHSGAAIASRESPAMSDALYSGRVTKRGENVKRSGKKNEYGNTRCMDRSRRDGLARVTGGRHHPRACARGMSPLGSRGTLSPTSPGERAGPRPANFSGEHRRGRGRLGFSSGRGAPASAPISRGEGPLLAGSPTGAGSHNGRACGPRGARLCRGIAPRRR